jgi:hypothetical protein
MATYYVNSGAGGANTGGSWTDAFTAFGSAVTAANATGDVIKVHSAHSESLPGDTTYTFVASVAVVCVDKDAGDALVTGAVIGAQATNYLITMAGAFNVYVRGITLQTGTSTTSKSITLASVDGAHFEYESCVFRCSGAAGTVCVGTSGGSAGIAGYTKTTNCQFYFTNAAQGIRTGSGYVQMQGCSLHASTTVPTSGLVRANNSLLGAFLEMDACDWSLVGANTFVADSAGNGTMLLRVSNSKLPTGTLFATQTTILNKGNTSIWVLNCASGDTHYNFYHSDAFGSTSVSASIYATAGAKYDGTNGCSWVIATTANCSFYTPYVSPWIDKYHAGTSAITPSLEILRDGSATAYDNDEVWGEFSYQGTSGSPLALLVNDRMTVLGSPAAQATGALAAGDWTGENATAWFGKLNPAATITPAEIGHLRARVVVGQPSITVYVDPKIRVA